MSCESRVNDSLKNFINKLKIRYWAIASKVIMKQGMFLKKRFDKGGFKRRKKSSLRKRKVDDVGDRR